MPSGAAAPPDVPASPSETVAESADPEPQKPKTPLMVGAVVVAVIAMIVFFISLQSSKPPALQRPVPTPIPTSVPLGSLVVEISPSGRAQLDGFETPDGGQRNSSVHRFTGLEPRSYSLTVWDDSTGEKTQKNVTVVPGQATTIRVSLH
jgi:hypothetical protein